MRAAVRGICDGFPDDYSRQKHAAGEPPTELWDALAEKGYLGVNLPEEWGGGGLGMSGLARGGRGDRGGGQVAAPDRGVARDRGQHPGPPRHRRAEGALAARHRRRHHQDRLRDHRAGRGHELAQPLHLGRAARRPAGAARAEDLHLGRRARRRRARGGAQPAAGRLARAALARDRGRGHARLHPRRDPDALHRPGQAVDALLRRRGARGGAPDRRRGRRARPGLRRPQPGAHHGRRDRLRRRPARARQGGRVRERARRVGRADRDAPGRRRTRSPRPRSSSSWPG